MPLYYGYGKEKKISQKNRFVFTIFILISILTIFSIIVFKTNIKYIFFSKLTLNKIEKNIESGNYDKSLKLIDNFSKKTFNPILFYYKGIILYNKKNLFDANIEFKRTLIFKNYYKIPDDVYYYIGKCNYYLGPSYYAYSLEYFKKYLNVINKKKKNISEIDNIKANIYFIVGKIYIYFEEYKNSDYYLTLIFNKYKNNLEYLYYYSISLKNNGKIEPSLVYLKKVVKESKNLNLIKQAYFLLGKIYFEKKQYDNALSYFNRLLEIKPDSYWAYYYQGYIYYLKKDYIKARNALSTSLHFNENNQLALKLLKKISSGDSK